MSRSVRITRSSGNAAAARKKIARLSADMVPVFAELQRLETLVRNMPKTKTKRVGERLASNAVESMRETVSAVVALGGWLRDSVGA